VVELCHLEAVGKSGDLVFFGADQDLNRRYGAPNTGGAAFVRHSTQGMLPWTQACGEPCHDVGLLTSAEGGPEVLVQNLFLISEYIRSLGMRPALIGSDHTTSLPCLRGTQKALGSELHYIYLDAHLDLGLHCASEDVHNGNFVSHIQRSTSIRSVTNIGGRSWSTFSPVYSQIEGFVSLPGGTEPFSLQRLAEGLSGLEGQPVYVSIDADVLDPSAAPGILNCTEPFGFSMRELLAVCQWLAQHCDVVGGDLCEIMPQDPSRGAEQGLMRCFHALFSRPKPPMEAANPPLGAKSGHGDPKIAYSHQG